MMVMRLSARVAPAPIIKQAALLVHNQVVSPSDPQLGQVHLDVLGKCNPSARLFSKSVRYVFLYAEGKIRCEGMQMQATQLVQASE